MSKFIFAILLLTSSTGFAQEKILLVNVATNESFKTYAAAPAYPVYPESTSWGRCMNNAMRGCMSSWYCAAGYSMQPFVYSAGFALGCAVYRDEKNVYKNRTVIPVPEKTF